MSIGEISNTINTTSDVSTLTRHVAEARFREASKPAGEEISETDDVTEGQKRLTLSIREKHADKVNEIKDFAASIGENLTDEDICYALKYGRSVLADYSA